jgi:hypothetical protein
MARLVPPPTAGPGEREFLATAEQESSPGCPSLMDGIDRGQPPWSLVDDHPSVEVEVVRNVCHRARPAAATVQQCDKCWPSHSRPPLAGRCPEGNGNKFAKSFSVNGGHAVRVAVSVARVPPLSQLSAGQTAQVTPRRQGPHPLGYSGLGCKHGGPTGEFL